MSPRQNPLFFKQSGGLDLTQFFLAIITVYVMAVFVLAGLGILSYAAEAWAFLGAFVAFPFGAWTIRKDVDKAQIAQDAASGGEDVA